MSTLSESLGGSHTFRHKGKDYTVSLVSQAVKIDYERALFARARDAASLLREAMTAQEYAAHLKILSDDYIAGGYAFESERGLAAAKSVSGMTLLGSLLFGCPEAEFLGILLARQEDVTSLIKVVMAESFPEQEPDTKAAKGKGPNARRPA